MEDLNLKIILSIFFGSIALIFITVIAYYNSISKQRVQRETDASAAEGFTNFPKFTRDLTPAEKKNIYGGFFSYIQAIYPIAAIFPLGIVAFGYVALFVHSTADNRFVAVGTCAILGVFLIPILGFAFTAGYKLYLDTRSPVYSATGVAYFKMPNSEVVPITVDFYIDKQQQYLKLFPSLLSSDQKNELLSTKGAKVTVEYTAYSKTVLSIKMLPNQS